MKALDRLETFLQDLMERPTGRLLPKRIHPLRLAAAITKELESQAVRLVDRIVVPGIYDLYVNREDWADLDGVRATLESELGEYIGRLAAERDLSLNSPPAVRLRQDPALRQGDVRAVASFRDRDGSPTPVSPDASRTILDPPRVMPTEHLGPSRPRVVGPIYSRTASLVLLDSDGGESQRFVIDRPTMTIGRRSNNDVPLPDLKVSREHARLEVAGRRYYLSDLRSTNGTSVNGRAVGERFELAAGDIIEVGRQRLRFEP